MLSNGSLHVGINKYGLVHDFYYPRVGLENHAADKALRHKIGVWVDGIISWLDDGSWTVTSTSEPQAAIGYTAAVNEALGLSLQFEDFVDAHDPLFFRNISVTNNLEQAREVRLFLHQAFVISNVASNSDTAQYLPSSSAILHYRGARAFVVGLQGEDKQSFDQHSIGLFGIEGHEGTYRDADDGELSCNDVEHGRVDSTLRHVFELEAHETKSATYWIAAGMSIRASVSLHDQATQHSLAYYRQRTATWWEAWLEPAVRTASQLPESLRSSFLRSAVILKTHIDNGGAVIASTDSTILKYSRDAYAYCWPRDAAYALWPLIRMGYQDEPRKFFDFCRSALHTSGYLMHKYYADGSLGPSWHPYRHGDISSPPIQEDETAIVAFIFAEFYDMHAETMVLADYYDSFVKKMGMFMSSYIDDKTHLPRPSYDLWEERFLTSTYTTSLVQAALRRLATLADLAGDKSSAVEWRSAADDMREHAMKFLYDSEKKLFRKGIIPSNETIQYDDTIDSASFYGAFMFGLVRPSSDELGFMYDAVSRELSDGSDGGVARYQEDNYYRSANTQPNQWYICAMWLAQYMNEMNKTDDALGILHAVIRHMSPSGMLSEQYDPVTQENKSVSPLAWSHAEFLSTALDMVETSE